MNYKVRPYKQKGDTCAIACMMMVLEYFKVMERANWYDEKRYYRIYGSKYMNGTPFSALAFHFAKNNLETKIFHEDSTLFNNQKKTLSDEDFKVALSEYTTMLERAEIVGARVINGIQIDDELVRKELEKGNLVIVAGEITGGYHAILISGYEKERFIICDPLFKNKQRKSIEELNQFMDTSIGKWFISVRKEQSNELEESL